MTPAARAKETGSMTSSFWFLSQTMRCSRRMRRVRFTWIPVKPTVYARSVWARGNGIVSPR